MGMMIRRNRAKKAAVKAASPKKIAEVAAPKEPVEEKKFSKSEINTMRVDALRALAAEKGLENPDEHTGAELKEWLIENM